MTEPFRKKFGRYVTLSEVNGGWRLRYPDPETGRDVRMRIPAATQEQAEQAAIKAAGLILEGKQYTPAKATRGATGLAVREALLESIRMTGARAVTAAHYLHAVNAFMEYLVGHFPDVSHWNQLRPSMLLSWVKSMQERSLAYDTIRNAITPIKRASAYWALEDPKLYRDFAKAARVKLERPLPKEIPALPANQLIDLLNWLKENAPALWPVAVLQGMAGLRMLEAAYLRRSDVDFTDAVVRVAKTTLHTPKNTSSHRTIPVHPIVIDALREYIAGRPVQDVNDHASICLNTYGETWTLNALGLAWQRALKGTAAAKVKELEKNPTRKRKTISEETARNIGARKALGLPDSFKPHNLRATFATLCRRSRCDSRALQAYLGHAPKDVLGAHYEAMGTEHLREEIVRAFTASMETSAGTSAGTRETESASIRMISGM